MSDDELPNASEVGFAVEEGMQQLVRIVRLQVPSALVETEDAAGGREDRGGNGQSDRDVFCGAAMDKIATERLRSHVVAEGIGIYPNIERMHHVAPERPGGAYEAVYAFGLRPEIRLPDLGGCEIKVPEPDTGGDFYERLIADLPRKMAEWEQADRPCQPGDRLTLEMVEPSRGKPFMYLLDEAKGDAGRKLQEQLIGAAAGDVRAVTEPESARLKVVKVERPLIPEFDLDFIRKLDPSCSSREQFDESFRKAHAAHIKTMTSRIMIHRCELLLEEATDDFPLPPGEVASELAKWRIDLERRLPGRIDFVRDIGEQGLAMAMARIESDLRRQLLLQAFVLENGLVPTDAEAGAYLDAMAAQYEEPEKFKRKIRSEEGGLERIKSNVIMGKFCDRVMDQARNVAEPMSFEQFEQLALGGGQAPQPA